MAKILAINVFTPAAEIQEPSRFAGRAAQLQSLARALESEGVQIVIYGNRGIGKSSLARQLEKLAVGDPEVTSRLEHKPTHELDFLPIFFTCDDSITSIPRLLLRLLSDDSALAAWVPFRVVKKEGTEEGGGKLDVKIISVSAKAKRAVTEEAQELETDIVSVFNNALKKLAHSGVAKDGVLLIIDEFDRVRDRNGIASLLKTLGSQRVKIALVGVATTVHELITEHESVARQLADGTIQVPPMSDGEMQDIFDRAEVLLQK